MRARERQGGDIARSSAGCGPRWSGRTSGSPRSSSTRSCATGRRREAPRSGTASGLSNGPEEVALRDALPSELRPPFTLSLHTRLRWGEQALRWQDVDVLSGLITIGGSKNDASRQVPMNAVVRSTLFDLSAQRARPNDPEELIFSGAYRTVSSPTTDETRGLLADLEEFVHDDRPSAAR